MTPRTDRLTMRGFAIRSALLLGFTTGVALVSTLARGQISGLQKIEHVIVVYQENWSFDSLYGRFPGADGLLSAAETVRQVQKDGRPYATLPPVLDNSKKPPEIDARFPPNLPVAPFDLARYVRPEDKTGDLVHRFYQEQHQIDGGRMDRFAAWSDNPGLVLSYYDATDLPEGRLARQYTMADHFFHAAFGGSFLNHFWLVCACTPTWPNAPAAEVVTLDAQGFLAKDGSVTPDGYAVNTAFSLNPPYPASVGDPTRRLPLQMMPTIGDRLDERGVSWAWYSGGWNDAVAGHPDSLFQFHHQVFGYFARYADGTAGRAAHLKDIDDFKMALTTGGLPSVSFVKPLGANNEHPGYASLLQGQQYVVDLVGRVQASPYWKDTVIIITYDENGGRWDHVAPPRGDRWGPGTRVPTIIVSPYAKKGFVDHATYDTTAILKLIEMRWNLSPLGTRDAAANPISNAFDFSQTP